ncbi:MAG TPA: site-2 protease family protein [Allosphingosinicella sp.]|jgi:Zn-dependent protease
MQPGNFVFDIATWLIPLVVAIVLHEISHGWVANAFGDPTARDLGRLSPNPIRHVDPIGTVVLPLFLAVAGAPVFGWAKPVPVVARRLRNSRIHMMLVAMAGPATNLLLGLVAVLALAAAGSAMAPSSPGGAFVLANLENFLVINVFLAIFNLLPIPPFDGSHVVEGLLPRPLAKRYAKFGKYGFLLLILLLVVVPSIWPRLNLVQWIVVPPVQAVLGFYLSLAGLA